MARVTLRQLRATYPRLFYSQEWFFGEPFMDAPLEQPLAGLPRCVVTRATLPEDSVLLPTAVQLAELYVRFPTDELWRRYLWTADMDTHGQRVYVGQNGQGLELHRHLALTERWGFPLWT